MTKMYIGPRVKCSLFLSDFNENLILLTDFENSSNTKFHEILPMGVELFHVGGRADGRAGVRACERVGVRTCGRADVRTCWRVGVWRAGGRTDSHDEANSRFPQFSERA
jgi:hypothetical protein